MYALEDLRRAVRTPRRVVSELNRLYHYRGYTRRATSEGVRIFDRDWDVLVVLDACRYDAFRAASDLPGSLSAVTSAGSHSSEWVRANFAGRRLDDVCYVTANPWFARLRDSLDATLFRHERVTGADGVATPGEVADRARAVHAEHPRKRLVVHFMQPHFPYLEYDLPTEGDLHTSVARSSLTRAEVHEAYRSNLELVLSAVADLLAELPGRVVVTADHGELLGDRQGPIPVRWYGHPRGVWVDALVTVPWLVHTTEPRPRIEPGSPRTDEPTPAESPRESLRALGYLE